MESKLHSGLVSQVYSRELTIIFLFSVVMSSLNIVSVLITNTLWLMILTSYLYVTFLGYTTLPNSTNTMAILAAVLPLGLVYIIFVPLKLNAATIFGHIFVRRCGETFDYRVRI